MTYFWLPAITLWKREMVRFFRQRSRVVGAIVPPILFWFLIGSGLGASFHLPGMPTLMDGTDVTYLQYFFPGTVVLIVLFTAIFSTISIIEDRHEGFLQSVLVAPVPRSAIVLGKIAGGTSLAFAQAVLFLALAPVAGLSVHWRGLIFLLVLLLIISFGLTGLGFFLAWKLDSTQGFHAIMNLLLIPMWLLSGTLFPVSGAPFWLRLIMRINPLTYGVDALREMLLVHGQPLQTNLASPWTCLAISIVFSGVMFAVSVQTARQQ